MILSVGRLIPFTTLHPIEHTRRSQKFINHPSSRSPTFSRLAPIGFVLTSFWHRRSSAALDFYLQELLKSLHSHDTHPFNHAGPRIKVQILTSHFDYWQSLRLPFKLFLVKTCPSPCFLLTLCNYHCICPLSIATPHVVFLTSIWNP